MSATRTKTVTAYDRLMRSRVFVGLDQEEMAERLGYSRRTISNWERGVSDPPMGALAQWAVITGRSIDWIVWGDQKDEAPAADGEGQESHLSDLNRRPVLYEGTALPLS